MTTTSWDVRVMITLNTDKGEHAADLRFRTLSSIREIEQALGLAIEAAKSLPRSNGWERPN